MKNVVDALTPGEWVLVVLVLLFIFFQKEFWQFVYSLWLELRW